MNRQHLQDELDAIAQGLADSIHALSAARQELLDILGEEANLRPATERVAICALSAEIMRIAKLAKRARKMAALTRQRVLDCQAPSQRSG